MARLEMTNWTCWLCGSTERERGVGQPGATLDLCLNCGLFHGWEGDRLIGDEESVLPPSLIPAVLDARRPVLSRLMELIAESRQAPGRLLDCGCGAGEFLDIARQAGWNARGVEPNSQSVALCRERGFSVEQATLETAKLEPGSVDVATLWDVLDMVPDPAGDLARLHKALAPAGEAWIRVRNGPVQARGLYWLGRLGIHRQTPFIIHRVGFSRATLRRLLEKTGFTDVSFVPSPMADPRVYLGMLGRLLPAGLTRVPRCLSPNVLVRARKPAGSPRVLHLITRLDVGGSSENTLFSAQQIPFSEVATGPGEEGRNSGGAATVLPDLAREIAPLRDLRALAQIARLLRARRPDILHTHSSKAGILGRWAAAWVNRCGRPIRVVHTPHGHVFYGYFGRVKSGVFVLLERITAWLTDRLVALTDAEMRESVQYGMGFWPQWRVVPSGMSQAALEPKPSRGPLRGKLGVADQTLLVGTIARLEPVKGVGVLVDAIARLPAGLPAARFVVIGDGGLRASLEERARTLGVADRIIFAGFQKSPEASIGDFDIYVQPSLNEGMCKTAIYAQAAGVPVVASRVCGLADVVREGESGLLFAPGDAGALAKALARLLADSALRKRLGAQGPAAVRRKDERGELYFSTASMVRKLRDLYAELQNQK